MKRAKEILDERIYAILDELEEAENEFDELVGVRTLRAEDLPKLRENRARRASLEKELRYKLDLYRGRTD